MAEDMDNQITHKPGYRHTENLQLKYDQYLQQLINSVSNQQNELNHVMKIAPQYNYENKLLLPKVETTINNNRQNAIGGDRDLQELENLNTIIQNKLKSQKFNMINCLGLRQSMKNFGLKLEYKYQSNNPLLSIQAITDNVIAVGSKNGLVQVLDLQNKEQYFTIQTKQPPITCMRIFKGSQGDFNVTSRTNVQGIDLKEQQYVITGNQEIKIWDIKIGSMIKQLKRQGKIIKNILYLLDDHTLTSGREDSKLSFWNAYSVMIMKKLQDHIDSMFFLVSVATSEDVLCISTSISPLNGDIYLNEKIVNEFGVTCGPFLIILRQGWIETLSSKLR